MAKDDWLHIRFRHPEVGDDPNFLIQVVAKPDEFYKDNRGGIHAIKRINRQHFLVVILDVDGKESYIRTAYQINDKKKKRRYRAWRFLQQF